MWDIILTILLIGISALLSSFLDLDNAALETLIEMIPLFILTFRLWYNCPRNYMYLLGFVNRNVKYHLTIKLEDCEISPEFYEMLSNSFKDIYQNQSGRTIRHSMGDYLWSTYFEVEASLIEVTFNLNDDSLYIETKCKTKFRSFINDVERILTNTAIQFSKDHSTYGRQLINIKLGYLNRKQKDIPNPFLMKFFSGFNNTIFNFQYKTKNGSKFTVNNGGVSIIGDNISQIKNDIRKEMLLF